MTNNQQQSVETTLQSLYRYYCEMRDTWYKGDYSDGISENVFPKTEKPLTYEEKQKMREAIRRARDEAETK